jgi:transcriptional regulator with XRE-family HTH domain
MSGRELDTQELASRLREVREYLNYSQQYVSEQTGLPRSAVSDIERGARRVSTLELKRLANVYGYRASYLLGEEPPSALNGPAAVLAREANELTPEDQQEVQRFITYLRSRNEAG